MAGFLESIPQDIESAIVNDIAHRCKQPKYKLEWDTPIRDQSCDEQEFARQSAETLGLDGAE